MKLTVNLSRIQTQNPIKIQHFYKEFPQEIPPFIQLIICVIFKHKGLRLKTNRVMRNSRELLQTQLNLSDVGNNDMYCKLKVRKGDWISKLTGESGWHLRCLDIVSIISNPPRKFEFITLQQYLKTKASQFVINKLYHKIQYHHENCDFIKNIDQKYYFTI